MTKPSCIHTVTGYRILLSRYFVSLINLQSPNLNTRHATHTSSTQPTRYTANIAPNDKQCTNFLGKICQSEIALRSLQRFDITFARTWLSVGMQQVVCRQMVWWVGRYIDMYVCTLNTNIHTTPKYIHTHIHTQTIYVLFMSAEWNSIWAQS